MAYDYGAKEPEKLKIQDMTSKEKELLIDSDTFCMMPWLHIHAFPDGRAYPCCFALDKYPVGDLNNNSMAEVFPRELLTIGGVTKNEKDYRYQIPKPYFDIVMKIIEKHKNQNQKHWRKRTEAGPEANLLEIYKENSKRYTQNIKDEIDNMKTLKGDVTNKYFDLYPDSWKNKETVVTGFLNRLILAQITIDLLELRQDDQHLR